MKNILLLLSIVSLFISCNGQEKNSGTQENIIMKIPEHLPDQSITDKYKLQAKPWKISEIIGQDTVNNQEIILYENDTINKGYLYGNSIQFHTNNTFEAHYSAPCGNDCFPSSTGEYFLGDENHIYIQVKNFQQRGDCATKNIFFNSGFINYYIQPTENCIKLIKSNGDLKKDMLNVQYSTLIDKYIQEVKNGSSALLNFKTHAIDNTSRVEEYIKAKTTIKNYKILYTKKADDVSLVNLVEDLNTNAYFFIINGFRNNYEFQVGYYKLKN